MDVDVCRRPITDDEIPALLELGRVLRHWRLRAGMTQARLADVLAMDPNHLWRVERGRRRTRESTLTHIAVALADATRRTADPLDAVEVLAALLDAGADVLAPETARSERSIPRKRKRRTRANLRHDLAMIIEMTGGDPSQVKGGPELYLRRRVDAACDVLLTSP